MHLKTVFIRFYKSFNDDFLRKNDGRVKPKPWEKIDGAFYPYIEVPIENQITTIVGANESGKSHLLSAIEKAITGKKIERSDFCRYSPFFTVKQNELKYPDFGTEWAKLSKLEDATMGLLASQEETTEQAVLEEILEELPEEIQSDAPVVDGKVQIGDGQNPTESTETNNNNSLKNDIR